MYGGLVQVTEGYVMVAPLVKLYLEGEGDVTPSLSS